MASKPAAVAADASATVGHGLPLPAVSGSWTKTGSITTKSYPKLTISGSPVIYEASQDFSFSGTGPTPASVPVSDSETVTLTASTTKLQKGEHNVLVDGDSKTSTDPSHGPSGNKVSISASGKLKSA